MRKCRHKFGIYIKKKKKKDFSSFGNYLLNTTDENDLVITMF